MTGPKDKNEIIFIHIGQAGVQMGNACWELFAADHGIKTDGTMMPEVRDAETYGNIESIFTKVRSNGKYVPRALFIDTEPSVVDEIRCGLYRTLFRPSLLINGKEDSGGTYASGFHNQGSSLIRRVMDKLVSVTESCDNFQGFVINHSVGGGTGSGFTSLFLAFLSTHFNKKSVVQNCIFPSQRLSESTVEYYNSTLHFNSCIEDSDMCFLQDNESLYTICQDLLNYDRPTYTTINRMVAQVMSGYTSVMRHVDGDTENLDSFQVNLVPFPRVHFPICSFSPIVDRNKINHSVVSAPVLTRACFEKSHAMINCSTTAGKYMTCSLFYRGKVSPGAVNEALLKVKENQTISFVDWCPTGFKVNICNEAPVFIPQTNMGQSDTTLTMLGNTSALCETFQQLNVKFMRLFRKRAFVHWFVYQGMEEGEFIEAKEQMNLLQNDYRETAMNS